MKLKLEFFGAIQDQIGHIEFVLTTASAPDSLETLAALLTEHFENTEKLLDPHLRIAVNDVILAPDEPLNLSDGDRIAFLSPFSGG